MVIHANWTDANGKPDGGVSTGVGYTISWQRGALDPNGRNGAFLIEVLEACKTQLEFYEEGEFNCEENKAALKHVVQAIEVLNTRKDRRDKAGILGSHKPD